MGRHTTRPPTQTSKPQGEQQLSTAAWAAIVKAIRAMNVPHEA